MRRSKSSPAGGGAFGGTSRDGVYVKTASCLAARPVRKLFIYAQPTNLAMADVSSTATNRRSPVDDTFARL